MGRFKDLFIERVPEERDFDEYECDNMEEEIAVSIDNVTQDNLIADVYESNGLSNQSQSIFKIEEIINTLPKEMPDATKRAAVVGILSTFGLTVEQVILDGESRKNVIRAAVNEIKEQNEKVIAENTSIIETKKYEIQDLETDTANRKNVIADSADKVSKEETRIDSLIAFIGKE